MFGSSVNLPAMEKLKRMQNYASWAFLMNMALIREGTWRVVKPLENIAVDPDMSDRAFATICLSLEKHHLSLAKHAETACENCCLGLLDKLTAIKFKAQVGD